jgi:hypothetical protein
MRSSRRSGYGTRPGRKGGLPGAYDALSNGVLYRGADARASAARKSRPALTLVSNIPAGGRVVKGACRAPRRSEQRSRRIPSYSASPGRRLCPPARSHDAPGERPGLDHLPAAEADPRRDDPYVPHGLRAESAVRWGYLEGGRSPRDARGAGAAGDEQAGDRDRVLTNEHGPAATKDSDSGPWSLSPVVTSRSCKGRTRELIDVSERVPRGELHGTGVEVDHHMPDDARAG